MSNESLKSNILIKSNVYPCPADIFKEFRRYKRDGEPISEASLNFTANIRGKKALLQFVKRICGEAADEEYHKTWLKKLGFQEWQIMLYWNLDTRCSFADDGHHPYGLVQPGKVELRCRDQKCKCFNKTKGQCGA
jgi:hypothetical protein